MSKIILGILGVVILAGGTYLVLSDSSSGSPLGSSAQPVLGAVTLPDPTQSASQTASAGQAAAQTAPAENNSNNLATISMATLHTNMGDIAIEFYKDQTPHTVANFLKLASAGFYDGTKFHRVIKGFMDQGGDPLTKDDTQKARWGTGGPGYTIPDEIGQGNNNAAGTIAMANTGQPDSAGSQFFINAVDNPSLNSGYTVFGKVTQGMEVVTAINNVQTDSSDRPLQPVVIESITLQ